MGKIRITTTERTDDTTERPTSCAPGGPTRSLACAPGGPGNHIPSCAPTVLVEPGYEGTSNHVSPLSD